MNFLVEDSKLVLIKKISKEIKFYGLKLILRIRVKNLHLSHAFILPNTGFVKKMIANIIILFAEIIKNLILIYAERIVNSYICMIVLRKIVNVN